MRRHCKGLSEGQNLGSFLDRGATLSPSTGVAATENTGPSLAALDSGMESRLVKIFSRLLCALCVLLAVPLWADHLTAPGGLETEMLRTLNESLDAALEYRFVVAAYKVRTALDVPRQTDEVLTQALQRAHQVLTERTLSDLEKKDGAVEWLIRCVSHTVRTASLRGELKGKVGKAASVLRLALRATRAGRADVVAPNLREASVLLSPFAADRDLLGAAHAITKALEAMQNPRFSKEERGSSLDSALNEALERIFGSETYLKS